MVPAVREHRKGSACVIARMLHSLPTHRADGQRPGRIVCVMHGGVCAHACITCCGFACTAVAPLVPTWGSWLTPSALQVLLCTHGRQWCHRLSPLVIEQGLHAGVRVRDYGVAIPAVLCFGVRWPSMDAQYGSLTEATSCGSAPCPFLPFPHSIIRANAARLTNQTTHREDQSNLVQCAACSRLLMKCKVHCLCCYCCKAGPVYGV